MFAAEIRKKRTSGMRSSRRRWHLDEVFVKMKGLQHYLWRAVDHEGDVLDAFDSRHRDKKAALKFLKKPMTRHGRAEVFVTDGLKSYGDALKEIGAEARQVIGPWENDRVENPHQPFRRRERAMQRFRRLHSLQKFVAVHSFVLSHFNSDRSLSSCDTLKMNRAADSTEWRTLCAA